MKTQDEIIAELEKIGVVRSGHFVLASGLHSDTFVSKDIITSHPDLLDDLVLALIERLNLDTTISPQIVVAPAVGAILWGGLLAMELGARFAYAEKVEGRLTMQRGFDQLIAPGTSVLVAEDIITTGESVSQVIGAVEALGGEIVGVGLIWLRGQIDLRYPVTALVEQNLVTWSPSECVDCQRGVPITVEYNKHGREFLEEYGTDPAHWPANQTS